MAAVANEIHAITPQLLSWSAYDPDCKVECFSSAYVSNGSLVLIDPIDLTPEAWDQLTSFGAPRSIVVTSENHLRSSEKFRTELRIPLIASAPARKELGALPDVVFMFSETVHGLKPIFIPGATHGETAYITNDGLLILGDSLINFPPALSLLPEKYLMEPENYRESLKKLLTLDFDTAAFAHGKPIATGAKPLIAKVVS
ncbi:MAG: hypothetical protein ACAI35_14030 [Candidatus Methylacidiphilales bacterium]|nr:hypothetical protein [Candidatus Methylacidiphilales bacterium]